MHRMRRLRLMLGDLAFDLTTPSPETDFGVTQQQGLHLLIRFEPPLEKEYATTTSFSVTHTQTKRRDTTLIVLPTTEHKRGTTYGEKDQDYLEFPTHVVQMTSKGCVMKMYVSLQNVQLRGDTDTPILEPVFNYGVGLFPDMFPGRYEGLRFFPHDLELNGKPVNLKKIPQGQSLALLKPNTNGITGNKVGKLLGFYPPDPDGKPEVMNGWKSVTMRLGTIDEPLIRAIYLAANPTLIFHEVGYQALPDSESDGSMADGLVQDGDVIFPVEFKRRRVRLNFDPSNLAQCIWEMAAGPTYPMIDLVEYCERQTKTQPGSDEWVKVRECRSIRLFRSVEHEAELIRLCRIANTTKPNGMADLWKSEPFVKMRTYLEELTQKANQNAKPVSVSDDVVNKIQAYKKSILEHQDDEAYTTHPIMDRIEKRQGQIFALYQENDKKRFVQELCEQIQDYSQLLKE